LGGYACFLCRKRIVIFDAKNSTKALVAKNREYTMIFLCEEVMVGNYFLFIGKFLKKRRRNAKKTAANIPAKRRNCKINAIQ
jgi:hypothetical protein